MGFNFIKGWAAVGWQNSLVYLDKRLSQLAAGNNEFFRLSDTKEEGGSCVIWRCGEKRKGAAWK